MANASVLRGLLVLWGLAGTCSNLLTGRILNKVGSRPVVVAMLVAVAVVILTMPLSGTHLWSAAVAISDQPYRLDGASL
ncbi:hypothetical protein AB4Y44_27430 [Paraburkholderia sp. BR10937]|uniref:hypothetical protein n=1 Tax=Paraburkholderia sp. BR10937 TaxID=3236994 RepID=UPI0034D30F97